VRRQLALSRSREKGKNEALLRRSTSSLISRAPKGSAIVRRSPSSVGNDDALRGKRRFLGEKKKNPQKGRQVIPAEKRLLLSPVEAEPDRERDIRG